MIITQFNYLVIYFILELHYRYNEEIKLLLTK